MNLQPLEDRIVVRPAEAEETTISGLVIPDTAKEKPQQGEVLAVGPGRRAEHTGEPIPLDIAVGDNVVYSKYGGTEITVDGEDVAGVEDQHVLTVDRDLGAAVLAVHDLVADLHVDGDQLAGGLGALARAYGQDLALLRLLLGGVGDDQAARRGLFGLAGLDDDPILEGLKG